MSKKAVDVVLLPAAEIAERAIKANAELVEGFGAEIVLDKEKCMPHISLAMGCIDDGDIAEIGSILEKIASQCRVGELTISGVRVSENSKGEKVSCFEVAKTSQLQSLHERVMEEMARYFRYDVCEDMLYGAEEIAESTLSWIKDYGEKSSFENFQPHITIGYGQMEDEAFVAKFVASKLAVCQLGNHCTCRRILAGIALEDV